MRIKTVAILALLAVILGAGIYWRADLLKFYFNLTQQVSQFNKISVDSLISRIDKQVLLPPPLRFSGPAVEANLTRAGVIIYTNQAREKNGLKPLIEDLKLNHAALAKAQEMFKSQYFDHTSPAGDGPAQLVERAGYKFLMVGENLALGNFKDDGQLVNDWLASPGHRENILSARFNQIGAAVVKGTYAGQTTWIGVQEFGLPLSACPEPSEAVKNNIDGFKAQLDSLAKILDDKQIELKQANREDHGQYNQLVKQYNNLVSQYNNLVAQIKNLIADYNRQVNTFNQCAK